MKGINEKFTDEEYEEMRQVKDNVDYNWHDLILEAIKHFKFQKVLEKRD